MSADPQKFDAEKAALALIATTCPHEEMGHRTRRNCDSGCIAEALKQAYAAGRESGIEEAADVASNWSKHYPLDVFPQPTPHSSPDVFSAAGSRNAAAWIEKGIRELMLEKGAGDE